VLHSTFFVLLQAAPPNCTYPSFLCPAHIFPSPTTSVTPAIAARLLSCVMYLLRCQTR